MNVDRMSDHKSRVILQRAHGSAPEWRTVGQIWIFGPDLAEPLHFEGGYTFILQGAEEDMLRQAGIVLGSPRRSDTVQWIVERLGVALQHVGAATIGAGLMFAWMHMFHTM
jgi:hypothetical protein